MTDEQLNIINQVLKEKKKKKKDLATFLQIEPGSLNRSLMNPNISFQKLKDIADFLEIDVNELLRTDISRDNGGACSESEVIEINEDSDVNVLRNLAEAVRVSARTMEVMAETERQNSESIKSLVQMLSKKMNGERDV